MLLRKLRFISLWANRRCKAPSIFPIEREALAHALRPFFMPHDHKSHLVCYAHKYLGEKNASERDIPLAAHANLWHRNRKNGEKGKESLFAS